ncbi:bleomycin resistance protein [Tateyamaria sp. SN6-1]|uniref:bleomycin resistance protein n=1 Tax=Tateyamaria sp. SN6-1 TaxID=3092148 RepID=UPI0039F5DD0D
MTQITPFVPCSSLDAQIGFYEGILGFEVGFRADTYAFLRRDAVAIRLVQVWDQVDLSHPEREGSFYIDVDGIDTLYAALKPRLDTLPEGRVRAPFDQDYGQREFHVADEDCTLIFFGEAI